MDVQPTAAFTATALAAATPFAVDAAVTPAHVITLAENLHLPQEAVTEKFAFLGQSGSGKTYAALLLAEQMLGLGAQIIALDPVGVWWGLRASQDGHAPGASVVIFGGEHGDVELGAGSGSVLGELLAEQPLSAVLDVSHLLTAETKRFVTDFAESFFQGKKRMKSPVHVFWEEAQTFAPQVPERDESVMLGRVERLIKLGRNWGVGTSLISQQPQAVHKRVLNQTGTLFALRTLGRHERRAIVDWVSDQVGQTEEEANGAAERDLAKLLPSLPTGTAHVWSPAFLRVSRTVQIARRATFDASATPLVGETRLSAQTLAAVDVDALRARLAQRTQEQAGVTPIALRARIRELETQLAARAEVPSAAGTAPAVVEKIAEKIVHVEVDKIVERVVEVEKVVEKIVEKVVEVPVFRAGEVERLHNTVDDLRGMAKDLVAQADMLASLVPQMPHVQAASIGRVQPLPQAPSMPALLSAPVPVAMRTERTEEAGATSAMTDTEAHPDASPVAHQDGSLDATDAESRQRLARPQQRILDVLAALEPLGLRDMARANVAVWVGQSPASGGFRNNLSGLRSAGLVEYPRPDRVQLTPSGRDLAQPVVASPTRALLRQAWYARLSGPQGRIMQALVEVYPDAVERDPLAALVGQSPLSGGYRNNLSALRTLGLVDYPQAGYVAATPLLFPHGLPE